MLALSSSYCKLNCEMSFFCLNAAVSFDMSYDLLPVRIVLNTLIFRIFSLLSREAAFWQFS